MRCHDAQAAPPRHLVCCPGRLPEHPAPGCPAESPTTSENAGSTSGASATEAEKESFEAWLANFRRQARAEGIDETTLARAWMGCAINPGHRAGWLSAGVRETDLGVSRQCRVGVARQQWARAPGRIPRYGSSDERAIRGAQRGPGGHLGIESSYGDYLGDFSTLEALATLAHDGRRRDFARGELLAALRIIEAGDISPERMKGSWAGAMGHTQFIPSSFLAHAVDGDGDGRRDIWSNIADVLPPRRIISTRLDGGKASLGGPRCACHKVSIIP